MRIWFLLLSKKVLKDLIIHQFILANSLKVDTRERLYLPF